MTKTLALGPLSRDVPFMVRNLYAQLRPGGQDIRREMGVESGAIGILGMIWMNPGISQSDLAASVALKKSAVTKVVTSLEGQGLVLRRRAQGDRRANALTLTDAGHDKIAIFRTQSEQFHARLFDGIDPADEEIFLRVLEKLTQRLGRDR